MKTLFRCNRIRVFLRSAVAQGCKGCNPCHVQTSESKSEHARRVVGRRPASIPFGLPKVVLSYYQRRHVFFGTKLVTIFKDEDDQHRTNRFGCGVIEELNLGSNEE